jgi:hypothetical protein
VFTSAPGLSYLLCEGGCYSYLTVKGADGLVSTYLGYLDLLMAEREDVAAAVYTQATDIEEECDGFYNYDRTAKLTADQTQKVVQAHQRLITKGRRGSVAESLSGKLSAEVDTVVSQQR